MKKLTLIALCLLLVIPFGLFASGNSEGKAASPDATVLTITYATGDVTTKEAVHDIITAFNASQSEYRLQENLSISTGAYLDSLKTLHSSGQFPDMIECRDVPVFVRAGMLESLDSSLLGLFESTVPVYGTVYTAPFVAAYPHMILYNKALFDTWGIDGNPKTYADFLAICESVKVHGIAPLAAGVADIWHIGFLFKYYFTNYCTHGDPDYISKIYKGEISFDNPEMIDAMKRLASLFRDGNVEAGFMSTKESQLVSLLVGEKAAMVFTGTWTIAQILEADPSFQIGFFPVPDDNGHVLLEGGATSQGWALSKEAAKDPKKKAAFNAFINFFFASEQYVPFLQKTNAFPTTREKVSYDTSALMQEVIAMNNASDKGLSWDKGVGENELPPSFRNWTYKKVQEMLMGKLEPAQLVKDMDKEWAVATRDFNPTILVEKSL